MGHERAAGDLLRTARAKAGLTQRDLAVKAEVTQSTIAAYESGRRQPTLPVLWRLLDAAGFEVRVRLAPPDAQTAATAAWERSRPPAEQHAWRDEQGRINAGSR